MEYSWWCPYRRTRHFKFWTVAVRMVRVFLSVLLSLVSRVADTFKDLAQHITVDFAHVPL